MKTKILSTLGAAALALGLSASASYAGYFLPGETMGTSLDSPLPEGVFSFDLESYGRSDNQGPGVANTGVNIPGIIWSTPWTLGNNRLEFLLAVPFAHLDGAVDRVGAITYALGPILAHDFGGGLTGGVSAFVRTPTPSDNIQTLDGRTNVEGDFRESMQYTFNGFSIMENAGITTAFNNSALSLRQNDFFAGDFTFEKTFDKLTLGITGYGTTDLQNRLSIIGRLGRASQVEIGGLIGYDFGRFSARAMVTRSILNDVSGIRQVPETRGQLVVVVPLYVAPTVAPIVARY